MALAFGSCFKWDLSQNLEFIRHNRRTSGLGKMRNQLVDSMYPSPGRLPSLSVPGVIWQPQNQLVLWWESIKWNYICKTISPPNALQFALNLFLFYGDSDEDEWGAFITRRRPPLERGNKKPVPEGGERNKNIESIKIVKIIIPKSTSATPLPRPAPVPPLSLVTGLGFLWP